MLVPLHPKKNGNRAPEKPFCNGLQTPYQRKKEIPNEPNLNDSPTIFYIFFRDSGIEVRDFGASWRDGIAFLAIIDAIKANIINLAEMKRASNRVRLETAFDVAESELGISRLLDPEDVDVAKPDEKSIMTYVAQFLHKYPEPKSTGPDAIAAVQEEYSQLLGWLMKKTQYLEHLIQTNALPLSYSEYLAFNAEVEAKGVVYRRLKGLIESQSVVSITKESWSEVSKLWTQLEKQMRQWLWFLDASIPELRPVAEWLAKAERMVYMDEIPAAMNEETASIISRKLEEHKAFFAELPAVQARFKEIVSKPFAREVPSEQLNSMAVRLAEIGPKAAQRRVRLKFLEHKVRTDLYDTSFMEDSFLVLPCCVPAID